MVKRRKKTRLGKKGRYKKKKVKVGGVSVPGVTGNGAVMRVYRHFSSKLSKLV